MMHCAIAAIYSRALCDGSEYFTRLSLASTRRQIRPMSIGN